MSLTVTVSEPINPVTAFVSVGLAVPYGRLVAVVWMVTVRVRRGNSDWKQIPYAIYRSQRR